MNPNELASRVAHGMLAAEGTGPAWGIRIEEARAGYARLSMTVRRDMLNGHGIVHGGMVFALADTAFAYVCNGRNEKTVAAQAGAALEYLVQWVDSEGALPARCTTSPARAGCP